MNKSDIFTIPDGWSLTDKKIKLISNKDNNHDPRPQSPRDYHIKKTEITLTQYIALNGECFSTLNELKNYIKTLPRDYLYSLRMGYTKEQLEKRDLYEIGYRDISINQYEDNDSYGYGDGDRPYQPAQTVTEYIQNPNILTLYSGTLADAISHATTIEKWWNEDLRFIRASKIKIEGN